MYIKIYIISKIDLKNYKNKEKYKKWITIWLEGYL